MWKSSFWVAWGFCILIISNLGFLAKAEDGATIKAIEVQYVGSKLVAEQQILAAMSTKVGDSLNVFKIDDDIKSLHKNGNIRNARILSNQQSGGVKLIVVVECSPIYNGATFQGNTVFSDRKLQRTINLPMNRAIQEDSIHATRQEIISMYQRRGYPDTLVECHIGKPDSRGFSTLAFVIEEKASGILRNVSFKGNTAITANQLKEVMSQKEKSLQNIVGSRGRTDAMSIAEDVRSIEAFYRSKGYFKAKVVSVAKMPVDLRYDDLVFTIKEGEVYTISSIRVNGVDALSANKDIMPYLKTQAGKPFSAKDLESDIKMITDQYRSRGYIDARVTPQLKEP